MRTIHRLPAAVVIGIGLNLAGNAVAAETPPDEPAPVLVADEPCAWDICPLPPDPEPEPDPEPAVDGADDLTDQPNDPCDIWHNCPPPPPPEDPCAQEPFVAADLIAPSLEDDAEIDDLVANPCDPGDDDPGDDPGETPDQDPDPCVLDEVCDGDPTFTG